MTDPALADLWVRVYSLHHEVEGLANARRVASDAVLAARAVLLVDEFPVDASTCDCGREWPLQFNPCPTCGQRADA